MSSPRRNLFRNFTHAFTFAREHLTQHVARYCGTTSSRNVSSEIIKIIINFLGLTVEVVVTTFRCTRAGWDSPLTAILFEDAGTSFPTPHESSLFGWFQHSFSFA